MPVEITGILIDRGLPGAIILVLLYVIRHIYIAYDAYRTSAEATLAAVTEKRIAEALKTVEALGRSEVIMDKMNDNVERAIQILERGRG